MARRAGKARRALPIRPTNDLLRVAQPGVELERNLSGNVAILTARMLQNGAHNLEGGQPFLSRRGRRLRRGAGKKRRSDHDDPDHEDL